MACFVGIDVGSVATKGVVIQDGRILCHHVIPSGFNYGSAAGTMCQELLAKAGVPAGDVARIVTTGCGAANAPFESQQASEIVCCARGAERIFPSVKTVISVGGQSSQVMRISKGGKVADFVVSERCAAGSARFLQVIANVLRVDLDDIGELSLRSHAPVSFSTGCAVFGETEAITRVAEGFPVEDILAGVHQSLAGKIASLVSKIGPAGECAISGGGALDIGLVRALEDKLGLRLLVPEQPQVVTAVGAAVLAQAAAAS